MITAEEVESFCASLKYGDEDKVTMTLTANSETYVMPEAIARGLAALIAKQATQDAEIKRLRKYIREKLIRLPYAEKELEQLYSDRYHYLGSLQLEQQRQGTVVRLETEIRIFKEFEQLQALTKSEA